MKLTYTAVSPRLSGGAGWRGIRHFDTIADAATQVTELLRLVANSYMRTRALEKLMPQIEAALPAQGGVLVGIVYQSSLGHTEHSTRLFLSAYTLGVGARPENVHTKFLASKARHGMTSQGPMDGYRRDPDEDFIWVTRK